MADIKAFKGFRPPADKVEKVASKPYDVMNRAEAKEMAAGNDWSFLRITRPEIEFPDSDSAYGEAIYKRAKYNFDKFVREGVLVQDGQASFYIYRLVMDDIDQTGVVCVCGIDDYWNDIIKKHEYTRPVKEKDRITNMTVSGIQPGPVFSAYKQRASIDAFVDAFKKDNAPIYDFTADDNVLHQLWKVSDAEAVRALEKEMDAIPAVYIADGHHRAASGSKVGQALRAKKGLVAGAPYNYFLSVLFPHNQLSIIDYNRVVKDLNGLTVPDFKAALEKCFYIEEKGASAYKPSKENHYGMYLDGTWYELRLKDAFVEKTDPVESLDIAMMDKYIFKPIFNIQDQRVDKRIDFVGGIRGMSALEERVDSGEMKVAFSIYPVSIDELFAVADSGNVMPPKSTWFEPKLRSGLFVHQID